MKVLIVYYSTYGHVHNMAEAIAEGVLEEHGVVRRAVVRAVLGSAHVSGACGHGAPAG